MRREIKKEKYEKCHVQKLNTKKEQLSKKNRDMTCVEVK